jgi:hypothetical protein
LTSSWITKANSWNALKAPVLELMVAEARVVLRLESWSSAQVAVAGSMISEPISPLLLCLIGSAEVRPVAPYSMGVTVDACTSPAYQ